MEYLSSHSDETSGTHSVDFTGLSDGVYCYTMRAGDFTATERVDVLK